MKLSRREKIMVTFLGFFLLWALSLYCVLVPQRIKKADYEEQIQQLELDKSSLDVELGLYDTLRVQLAEEKASGISTDFLYKNLDDVNSDRTLQELAQNAGVQLLSMKLGEPERVADREENDKTTVKKVTVEEVTEPVERTSEWDVAKLDLYVLTVTVSLKGEVDQIMQLVDAIYQADQSMAVTDLQIQQSYAVDANGARIPAGYEGNMTVAYYYIEG